MSRNSERDNLIPVSELLEYNFYKVKRFHQGEHYYLFFHEKKEEIGYCTKVHTARTCLQ